MKNDLPLTSITIPAVGRVPAYVLDTEHRTQVANLIGRVNALINLSARACIQGTHSGHPEAHYKTLSERENTTAEQAAALLAPLGISTDWPGPYPSFAVNGYSEHTTEAAVLAALGHPRNWLTA